MITSAGYAGTVTEVQWADLVWRAGGAKYGVAGYEDWRVSVAVGDRAVQVAPGKGWGCGVVDVSDKAVVLALETVSTGDRWDLVVAQRDWSVRQTTFSVVKGGSSRVLPSRPSTEGVRDAQPIALVRVRAGQSQVQEIVDLRVLHGPGGALAFDQLALSYLDDIGSAVRIGASVWDRTISNGNAVWSRSSVRGGVLDVIPIDWYNLAPSGYLGSGVQVWGADTQNIASAAIPNPGVPYRVSFLAAGWWGCERGDQLTRFDLDAVVGSTVVDTYIPTDGEFPYSAFKRWSGQPSQAVFEGAQSFFLRARRIYGSGYGALGTVNRQGRVVLYAA